MDVPVIVRKVLEVSGLKQAALGKKIGVSQGTISKWMKDEHSPNLDQWARLAVFANRYPNLREAVKGWAFTSAVPIMGYIGAGAEISPDFEQVPSEGLEQVDLPFSVSADMVAFRVKGDSMIPVYRDGDVVLVWSEQRNTADAYCYADEVAVKTAEGNRYLKEIQPGQRKGHFNLVSHNAKLIRDVQIEWVGEIYLTIRNNQVRKAGRPKGRSRKTAKG